MRSGHPPPISPPGPAFTSDIREAEARIQLAIESKGNDILNEMAQTNQNIPAAIAQIAALEAKVASSETELRAANRELDAMRSKVSLLT